MANRAKGLPRERLWLAGILLLAAALRLTALGQESLWLDEVITLWQVQRPLPEVLRAVAQDIHPPLYYLLLHTWLAMRHLPPAGGEAWVRLPAALASLFGVLLIYLAGRRLATPRVGLLAATMLAVFPLDVWYAREARMYSLAAMWGIAAIWAGLRATDTASRRDHVLFALVSLAGLYTHYPFIVLWLACALGLPALARRRHRPVDLRRWGWTQIAILVAAIPLAWLMWSQAGGELAHSLARWALNRAGMAGGALIVGGTVAVGLMLLVRRRSGTGQTPTSRLWLAGTWGGSVLLITIALWRPISSIRQLVLFTPPLLLAWAWAWQTESGRPRRRWDVALAVTLVVALVGSGFTLMVLRKEAWRDVAALVMREGEPQDGVLVHAGYLNLPFRYYYRGDLPVRWAAQDAVPEDVPGLARPFQRTWLVEGHLAQVDPNREVESWFGQHEMLVKQTNFRGVSVRLYRRR